MSFSAPLRAQDVVPYWHLAAADHDFLSAIPEVNEYYVRRNWHESDFANVLAGFAKRQSDHAEFLRAHPYSWATQREAYEYSIDALYQLQAIDVVAGIWHDSDQATRTEVDFDRICVRQTRRWGGPADISPRAVPATVSCPVKFILVPFGWDNYVSLTIEGFAKHSPSLFEDALSSLATHRYTQTKSNEAKRNRYWNALIACSLVSVIGCPEVLVTAAEQLLVERISSLRGSRKHLTGHDSLSRKLSYSQAALVYSIAHEVGHHLQDVYSDTPTDPEYLADNLAYRGLWNYPGGISTISPQGEAYDSMSLLAGGLFHRVISFGLQSDYLVGQLVRPSASSSWPIDPTRQNLWQSLTEEIVSKVPELAQPWQGIQVMLAAFDEYQQSYEEYLRRLLPELIPQARSLLAELQAQNPNLDDPEVIARRFREEMDQELDGGSD